jgi:hypothetical protein
MMKLSVWVKRQGITYRTAWNWFKEGKIPHAKKMPSGSIFINEKFENINHQNHQVAIYTRVSSSENKKIWKHKDSRIIVLPGDILLHRSFKKLEVELMIKDQSWKNSYLIKK